MNHVEAESAGGSFEPSTSCFWRSTESYDCSSSWIHGEGTALESGVVPVVPDFSTNSCIITNITAIIVTLLQPNASPFHPFPMPLAGSCWNSTGISCGHVPWHGYWLLATQGRQSMAILRFHPIRCVLGRDSYTLNRSQEAWFNLFHVQISCDQILYLPN